MDVDAWLEGLAPSEGVLAEMEQRARAESFPIVGPLVGRLLGQWTRAVGARSVFEMGSGFGYSTAWFAAAVGAEGRVVHTDGSEKRSREARTYLDRMGLGDRVERRVGDARDIIRADDGTFDIVFIDIDKEGYPEAWDLAAPRVRPGGLVITDNALWSGRVADPAATDEATQGVRTYLRKAYGDPGFLTTVAPVRDGVAVSLRLP